MMMRMVLVVLIAAAVASCGTRSARNKPAAASAAATQTEQREWLKPADYRAGGPVPPMEANRKINEQSCTQDINVTAGNLRCR